jgi:hypothetical protein
MGLKIVYHTESQSVKKISLTAMPLGEVPIAIGREGRSNYLRNYFFIHDS